MGLAVAVVLVPGCLRLNAAYEDAGGEDAGSGGGTSMTGASTGSGVTGSTLPTASGSGVTGVSTPPTTTTTSLDPDVGTTESDSEVSPGDWWNVAYAHRVPLVFHALDQPLEGFVAHVPLELSPSLLQGVSRSQFAFVDVDSDARIPAEIVEVDPVGGEVLAWVRLPVWKGDGPTVLHLYFGDEAPEEPSANPWSDHVGVWHMDTIRAGVTPDAVGSADAEQVPGPGEPPTIVPGLVGGSVLLDGEEHRLEARISGDPADDTFLVSAWVNVASYASDTSPIIARGDLPGSSWESTEWAMTLHPERAEIRLHDDVSTVNPTPNAGVSVLGLRSWHHYAFVYTGTSIRLYTDGNFRLVSPAGSELDHVFEVLSIGGYADPMAPGWETRLIDGQIDELRWRRGAVESGRNDVWVRTLFENQADPQGTFTAAPVESY